MFRALLATASLAAGLLTVPAAAFAADTTTPLTAAEMSAALKGVAGTTAPAELPGWVGGIQLSYTDGGATQKGTASFGMDAATGRGFLAGTGLFQVLGVYAESGKGQWVHFNGKAERAAMAMAGHPAARYVFQPDTKLKLDDWASESLPAPSSIVMEDTRHAGTRTLHDDSTIDYAYADDEKNKVVFTVDSHGVLTSTKVTAPGLDQSFAWKYGPQTITLPSAAQTVGEPMFTQAMAYLATDAKVKWVATNSAKVVTSKAKKRTVKVADLRKWTRSEVSSFNSGLGVKVVVASDVKGGVKLSATNPFTKATAAWTVKASGKKAIAKKL